VSRTHGSVVIWGASGHASMVADALRQQGRWELAGYLDDDPRRRGELIGETPILGGREQLGRLREDGLARMILGFGDGPARLRLAERVTGIGFELVTVIHPAATVAPDVEVGVGTVIAAGAVVNPGSRIGDNVIVNTGATVDHHCVIGRGAHICPGAHLGGSVTVGELAWVGLGAAVRNQVTIGAGTTVGVGAAVVGDLPAGVVAYGVPARVVRRATPESQGEKP
jgi:UDP-N-acetylbacillosamine N-acetyltransferase